MRPDPAIVAAGAPVDRPTPAAPPARQVLDAVAVLEAVAARATPLHPRADRGRWRQRAHRDLWFEAAWFGIPWRLAAAWVGDVEARSPEGGR